MPASGKFYTSVYRFPNLLAAWETVKRNGLQSKSDITKQQIKDFDFKVRLRLGKIQKQLKENKFSFSMDRGVPIQRGEGKDDRPLVVSPVENRIVQRAILNVLQMKKAGLQKLINNGSSFGGIEEKSVADALKLVAEKTQAGAKYFARSDIKSFFTKIPKQEVLDLIKAALPIKDEEFENLLELAINIELENLAALGIKASLFPDDETGVAQGSCLSPFLGNLFLLKFDELSNSHDVTCIRFVDDYVILGPSDELVRKKFEAGKKWLVQRGLEVYEPYSDEAKGQAGPIHHGFDFLGCDVFPGRISPSTKSVAKFRDKIHNKMRDSFRKHDPTSLAEALTGLKNTVQGWGNSYQFCNDPHLVKKIDDWFIDEVIKFHGEHLKRLQESTCKVTFMKKLGVSTLSKCKTNPIYKAKKIQKSAIKV